MRILILSDIHANLVALDTVLADAGAVDQVWCLGDVVGYGPLPNETINRLRALNPICLAGNHDWAVLDKLDLEEFNPEARQAILWTRAQIDPANYEWLDALPERVPTQNEKFTLIHGSPRYPIWEYILTPTIARTNFDYFDTPICLYGHTHIPMVYRHDENNRQIKVERFTSDKSLALGTERMMINPGSVGQPRDSDPRASYAILDLDALTLTNHRVAYDIRATQIKMQMAQLPLRLIQRLEHGW